MYKKCIKIKIFAFVLRYLCSYISSVTVIRNTSLPFITIHKMLVYSVHKCSRKKIFTSHKNASYINLTELFYLTVISTNYKINKAIWPSVFTVRSIYI